MQNILLIGGTGYIGSALCLHLAPRHAVATVDLEWFGNFVNPDNLKLDFRELGADYLSRFSAVVLLAGHSSVGMCDGNMLPSFENNVRNFVGLLAKLSPSQKFIYASSSSIYGDTGSRPVSEDWRGFAPKTYYDLNKQEIDYYAELSGLDYYGLRFGTVNGFSPNLRSDIMINKMFCTAKAEGQITVFNKDISRPILGIRDLCRAVEAIIGCDTAHPGLYNLASFNATIDQISRSVAAILGNVEVADRGSSPTYNFSIDTSKFECTFGFRFEETVDSIVKDLADNYDRATPSVRNRKEYV